jgi:hypothetical protein
LNIKKRRKELSLFTGAHIQLHHDHPAQIIRLDAISGTRGKTLMAHFNRVVLIFLPLLLLPVLEFKPVCHPELEQRSRGKF